MDIVLKVSVRRHLWKDLLDNALMIFQNLFKCIGVEVVAREQVDELAEREAAQVV